MFEVMLVVLIVVCVVSLVQTVIILLLSRMLRALASVERQQSKLIAKQNELVAEQKKMIDMLNMRTTGLVTLLERYRKHTDRQRRTIQQMISRTIDHKIFKNAPKPRPELTPEEVEFWSKMEQELAALDTEDL